MIASPQADCLRRALQYYLAHEDLEGAAALLLEGMLTLTASTHGFLGEVPQIPECSPMLRIHAATRLAADAGLPRAPRQTDKQGMEFVNLETLFGAVIRTGEPVVANTPATDPRAGGIPDWHPPLHAFLGVPVYLGETLTGVLGLANRPGGYDLGIVECLAPLADTYATLIEAARLRAYQQRVIDELDHARANVAETLRLRNRRIQLAADRLRRGLQTILDRNASGAGGPDPERMRRTLAAIQEETHCLFAQLALLDDEARLRAAAAPETGQTPPRSPPRILAAEDDPATRALLRMQLTTLGVTAEIVGSGAEALAAWQHGHWDLILSDERMPEMTGADLTRAIRLAEEDRGGRVPIVAFTAGTPDTIAACHAAGMDDVLPKPITLDALRGILRRWCPEPALPPAVPPAPVLEPVLDLDGLRSGLGTLDRPRFRELTEIFVRTVRDRLARLAGEPPADLRTLEYAARHLELAARAINAHQFAELARQLARSARTGQFAEAGALLPRLAGALPALEQAIARIGATLPECADPPGAPAATGAGPRTALVIDDNAVTRRRLTLLLESFGMRRTLAAADGHQALARLATAADCDLVLCELCLPELDGVQLLRQLSMRGYQGRLILIGSVEPRLLRSALELARLYGLNVCGILRKPAVRQDLAALLLRPSHYAPGFVKPRPQLALSGRDLVAALQHDALRIHYQPKVDANTLQVVGVEALARWYHDALGFVPPDFFIELAERGGLIAMLSEYLLEQVCRGLAALRASGETLHLSFNLSAAWLNEIQLPELLLNAVFEHGLRPEDIILELTETGVMADPRTALDIMMRLRLKGFRLSIDDFGIGYSSMQQLQRFPFSELKLDRGFVHDAARNPERRAILASSVQMARKLSLHTVAEGVETQEDLDLIRALGCELVQGWLIAKAMPLDELLNWLRQARTGSNAIISQPD